MTTIPVSASTLEAVSPLAQEVASPLALEAASPLALEPHNGREARNLAEKQRRDKLNASIQELAKMVPHVAEATRRIDKTAVLRFAAHGLRLNYVFGKSAIRKRRSCSGGGGGSEHLSQPQLTETLMQLLDSFFITLTCHGQIIVVSASVEQLLGHCQSDLYGQNILTITHPEDQALLLQQLIPRDLEALFRLDADQRGRHRNHNTADEDDDDAMDERDDLSELPDDNDETDGDADVDYYRTPSPRTQAHFADIDARLRDDRRCFTVRLARAGGTRCETAAARNFELVKIDGCFRRSDFSTATGNLPIVSQLIRRSRSNSSNSSSATECGNATPPYALQHDAIAQAALHGISGNDIVLVAMARIIRPPKIINRLVDGYPLEYRTRHLIDGRIIDCDQRISLVAGYMKDEVRNLSPFSFMHLDDVRWVIVALRQMYDCNSDYGESCYRLLARNGHFIYLQTKGYMEIDKNTNKVHSFVCVNTLLPDEEGRRRVQEMKKSFSVIIKANIPGSSLDLPASQNPQQLERIVLYLIEDLQKRPANGTLGGCTESCATSPMSPMSLVPPEPASVKSSISKSVNVVNETAARKLPNNSLKSPFSEPSLSPANGVELAEEPNCRLGNAQERPSVLQLTTTTTPPPPATPLPKTLSCTKVQPQAAVDPSNQTSVEQPEPEPTSTPSTVLKRLRLTPSNNVCVKSISTAKRSVSTNTHTFAAPSPVLEVHTVLSSSLQVLDESLYSLQADARSLRQQSARLQSPVRCTIDRKLDAIIVEHQMQTDLLSNIKSEYDMHQHEQQQQPNGVAANSMQAPPLVASLPDAAALMRHSNALL